MASSGGFKPSNLPPIAETGMKGFLKWDAREQPGYYPRVAKATWAQAPEVFSDYVQSRAQGVRPRAGLASLACGPGIRPSAHACTVWGRMARRRTCPPRFRYSPN